MERKDTIEFKKNEYLKINGVEIKNLAGYEFQSSIDGKSNLPIIEIKLKLAGNVNLVIIND